MSLLGRHQPADEVAFGGPLGARTVADLLWDAGKVAQALAQVPPGGQVLMVFKSDRYAFTVGLLAAWSRELSVVLPANLRAETITGLLGQGNIGALLHDTNVAGHVSVPQQIAEGTASALTSAPSPGGIAACVMTSGSTGQSQTWNKTFTQLCSEVEAWTETFALVPGQRFVATVPPTHLYGLLFSVLLPLVSGGSLCRETPLLPEALAARIEEQGASVLVTVPVHLRSTEAIEAGRLASLTRVFSSTAPLRPSVVQRFREQHGLSVTEIFGSSETGGIAYRDRSVHDRWQPAPGVKVSASAAGLLVVDSPFCSQGLERPYLTADRIELFSDGSFQSLGRQDNVVKVGGNRVSLSALEEWLLRHSQVRDAVVLAVEEPQRDARIVCALVAEELSEPELRRQLAEHFEPATIPRRFVFVHSLPREASGKLQRHRVLRLFGMGADGTRYQRSLDLAETSDPATDSEEHVFQVEVPTEYVWYGGHFDAYPVMAGVVQLQALLLPLVQRLQPSWSAIRALSRVKFTGRILPGDSLQVRLRVQAEQSSCDFQVFGSHGPVSAGRLGFFAEPEPRREAWS